MKKKEIWELLRKEKVRVKLVFEDGSMLVIYPPPESDMKSVAIKVDGGGKAAEVSEVVLGAFWDKK